MMNTENEQKIERDNGWAAPVDRLKMTGAPGEAVNLNVEGRKLTGPVHGFGQLWKKTYQIRLSGARVTPQEVISSWKARFPRFWPSGNWFYGPPEGITPGSVALLNLAGPGNVNLLGGAPVISTGIMVIYADEESFTFMTSEGHMFAGVITFSAFELDSTTVAQVQAFVRANDPIYELTFRLGFGQEMEDKFWRATLANLAAEFGVRAEATQKVSCLDPNVQWREAGNIRYNAAIRTAISTPVRLVRGLFVRR